MNQIKILKTIPLGTTEFTFETRKKFLTHSNGIAHSRSTQPSDEGSQYKLEYPNLQTI